MVLQVRVNNLQELVYKQGQAGVTKASVSIVFNNDDKKASPVGYEQYNKITVTRQVHIVYSTLNKEAAILITINAGSNWWQEQIPHKWTQRTA